MNNRDDFTKATRDILRARAGDVCSNPGCRVPTSGPAPSPDKVLNGGIAAHITAAAKGGKRYNPSFTPEQRKDPSNGIWLCIKCASMVDKDEFAYSVEYLNNWKLQSEVYAAQKFNNSPIQTGNFDTKSELDRARKFRDYLSPLFDDLLESIRRGARYYPLESRSVNNRDGYLNNSFTLLAYVGSNFGVHGWSDTNEFYSFNPSIRSKQENIIHLCSTLYKLLSNSDWKRSYDHINNKNVLVYKENSSLSSDDYAYLQSIKELELNLFKTLKEF